MALSTEETQELNESYRLLSADELRGQLGDDAEHDALINAILSDGKAVETKGSKEAQEGHGDPEGKPPVAGTKKDQADADEDDGEEGFVDEHGNPVAVDADGKPVVAAAAEEVTAPAAEEVAEPVTDVSAEVPKLNLSFLDAEYDTAIKALDAEKAEKFTLLMDGTLKPAEYAAFESEYMRKRDGLAEDRTEGKAWFTGVHAFQVEAARTTGINYATDAEKGAALDDWCKRLGAKPENQDKAPEWFLAEAHRKVMAEFDIRPGTAPTAQKAEKATVSANKVAQKTGRAPNLSNIPPTLGGLPAAAEQDTGDGGEFAHLDKLSGMAFEQAIARMSADQRDRYAAG